MGKEGGPSGDEGSRDGLTQGFWALAGSGMGELAEEPCSFTHVPTIDVTCYLATQKEGKTFHKRHVFHD